MQKCPFCKFFVLKNNYEKLNTATIIYISLVKIQNFEKIFREKNFLRKFCTGRKFRKFGGQSAVVKGRKIWPPRPRRTEIFRN